MKSYQKAVYKTQKWKYVRKAVIERDKDICYFCGKLILKKPVIHHLQEIDETNFNDYDVAFNLDNLVEVHYECHNEHHNQFGYKTSIVNDDLNIDYSKRKELYET